MNASRQSLIVSALLCALLSALFVVRWRIAPWAIEAPSEGGMPLAAALTRFTLTHGRWAAAVAAVVVGWTLLLVVQLSVKYAPPATRNYLPPQIFLIAAGGMAVAGEALAALMAAWLLTLSVRQFAFSLRKGYSFTELFHAGFWLGFIPLLYAPAALFAVPVAVSALAVYRRSPREWTVCFAGLALPLPAAAFIHWAVGGDGATVWRELWRCTVESPGVGASPTVATAAVALLVVALALTALGRAAANRKNTRKTQSKFIGHISLTLFWVAATAVLPGSTTTLAALLGVPCAVCLPYAFTGRGAGISTVIYSLIMAAVLALNLLPVLGIPLP